MSRVREVSDMNHGARRREPRSHAGFTLIEVMIGLVLAAIVGGTIMSLLTGQIRYYERAAAAVNAQQNLRAASDLAASELRMAQPLDVIAAESDSVSIRFDVARGVVCDTTSSDQAVLFVYDTVPNAVVQTGVTGIAYSGPYDSAFVYADAYTGTVTSSGAGPRSTCVNNGAPGTLPPSAYRSVSGWQAAFPGPGVPPRGSTVRRYGQLTYRFAPSIFGTGFGLFRGALELAGPFDPTSSFSYVMANGTVQSSVTGPGLPNIRAVRINAIAIDDGNPHFALQRSLQLDIRFRN